MISGDSKLRDQFRDLPTGYLLDLLADKAGGDEQAMRTVLRERGLDPAEIERLVQRRAASRLPRGYALWRAARVFTLACTALVAAFNLVAYYRLLHGTSSIKGLMLGLSVVGALFGFFLGYKLTTHIYHGARHRLDCGFPLPVGSVDLRTGQETVRDKPMLVLCMAVNATVGLSLILFPLLLIHHVLH